MMRILSLLAKLIFGYRMMNLLYVTWTIDPEIFSIGPISIRWYGLLFASAFLVGHYIIQKMLEREEQPKEWMDSLLIYMMVGTVLGARLGHVFFYQWDYYSENLLEIIQVWKGGLASHGGVLGIVIALILWSRKVSNKSVIWILDRVAIAGAIGAVFIRLGNLMNHEIVGNITNAAFGFKFLRNESDLSRYELQRITGLDFLAPNGAINDGSQYSKAIDLVAHDPKFSEVLAEIPTRYPAQLMEAASYLVIFMVIYSMYTRFNAGKKSGLLLGVFLALQFTARFFIEFYKEVQVSFEDEMTLNMGQWLSIPLVLVGVFFVVRSLTQKQV